MNRKKAVWLLTAIMAVTSIDSSVLMANAADFSAETSEFAQDFTSEAEAVTKSEPVTESETVTEPEVAAESDVASGIDMEPESDASEQTAPSIENQDFAFEDDESVFISSDIYDTYDAYDTYGYALDENGNEIVLSDSDIVGSQAAKASSKEKIDKTKCTIKSPYMTTQISGYQEDLWYAGLEVTIAYESGKTVTYKYNNEEFRNNITISNDFQKNDDGNIKPGEYTITVKCGEEEIGTIPFTVMSLKDYMDKFGTELPSEVETSVKVKGHSIGAYFTVAPETAYYRVNYVKKYLH